MLDPVCHDNVIAHYSYHQLAMIMRCPNTLTINVLYLFLFHQHFKCIMSSKVYLFCDDGLFCEVDAEKFGFLLGSNSFDMINAEMSQIRKTLTSPLDDEEYHQPPAPDCVCGNDNDLSSQMQDSSSQQTVKIAVDTPHYTESYFICNESSKHGISTQKQNQRGIPSFTKVDKSLHSALDWSEDTVDRLTDEYSNSRLMSRGQYENLCSSIEKIHEYMQETITSNNTQDILDGLEKLFNGGHISKYQQKTYIARYKLNSG